MGGEQLDPCAQIAESVGYSENTDDPDQGSMDALIAYKNGLEDALRQALADDTGAGLQGNAWRAAFGRAAVDAGTADRGQNESERTDITDAMANVLHYANSEGWDAEDVIERARDYYESELEDKDPPPIAA